MSSIECNYHNYYHRHHLCYRNDNTHSENVIVDEKEILRDIGAGNEDEIGIDDDFWEAFDIFNDDATSTSGEDVLSDSSDGHNDDAMINNASSNVVANAIATPGSSIQAVSSLSLMIPSSCHIASNRHAQDTTMRCIDVDYSVATSSSSPTSSITAALSITPTSTPSTLLSSSASTSSEDDNSNDESISTSSSSSPTVVPIRSSKSSPSIKNTATPVVKGNACKHKGKESKGKKGTASIGLTASQLRLQQQEWFRKRSVEKMLNKKKKTSEALLIMNKGDKGDCCSMDASSSAEKVLSLSSSVALSVASVPVGLSSSSVLTTRSSTTDNVGNPYRTAKRHRDDDASWDIDDDARSDATIVTTTSSSSPMLATLGIDSSTSYFPLYSSLPLAIPVLQYVPYLFNILSQFNSTLLASYFDSILTPQCHKRGYRSLNGPVMQLVPRHCIVDFFVALMDTIPDMLWSIESNQLELLPGMSKTYIVTTFVNTGTPLHNQSKQYVESFSLTNRSVCPFNLEPGKERRVRLRGIMMLELNAAAKVTTWDVVLLGEN